MGFVADCSEGKATVSQTQTTAIPVVNRLNTGILQRPIDKIVSSICRQIESRGIGLSELEKRLQLLALNQRRGAPFFVDRVEKRMAEADGSWSPAVAGKDVIGVQASTLRVVVHVPFDAQILDRFKAQAGNERR